VKHLLIILSLLLLSSPVIGDNHKGETLYGWGKYPEIVWKGFGDKETHPKYEGDVENGIPNGLGFLIFPNGGKYVGGWKDGRRNGEGTFTLTDGKKYEGEYKDGEMNGQGTLTLPDGSKFVGEYKNNKRWNGIRYDKDGNIDGMIVNGEWIGHKGETLYRWDISSDVLNPIYVWKGFGDKETNPKYQGDVENGKPNGLGFLIYPIGHKYVGSWKNGKMNGQGTFTFFFGGKYEGEYKDGEMNGQGTWIFPEGAKYVGEWKDGKIWNGKYYDKNGNMTRKYVNGKTIRP